VRSPNGVLTRLGGEARLLLGRHMLVLDAESTCRSDEYP
jgi:hypothetical protein